MKASLGMIMVLILSTALWAQGDQTDCEFSVQVDDVTCGNGCEKTTFTAPATASNYKFSCALLYCSGGPGVQCRMTATLVPILGGGTIATCDNQGQEDCVESMPVGIDISLQQGVQYRLTVCLDACYSGCDDCDDCTARATICR